MRIFLDTSGLIALSDRKDKNHGTARAYLEAQVHRGPLRTGPQCPGGIY